MRPRLMLAGAAALVMLNALGPDAALARLCSGNNDHGCWIDYSGPNFSQVAVTSLQGQGLACAVQVGNDDDWGGNLSCFRPLGTSGYTTPNVGWAGDPILFVSTDPNRRMASFSMYTSGNYFIVPVLRSDGEVYSGIWPLSNMLSGPPMSFTLSADPIDIDTGARLSLRSIAVYQNGGAPSVWVLDASNHLYSSASTGQPYTPSRWRRVWSYPDSVTLAGGAPIYSTVGIGGTDGTAHSLLPSSFPAVPGWVWLPFAASDPNAAFDALGRTSPLAVGTDDAWMATWSSDLSQVILRSTRVNSTWSSWAAYNTGAVRSDFSMDWGGAPPWSIADARAFRGARGEIFAIGANYHLLSYSP